MKFSKYKTKGAYHWDWYETVPAYRKRVDRIKNWVKEKDILDIGAGDGLITKIIGAYGIDNEPEAVRLAEEKNAGVFFGDVYCLPQYDNSFEAVLMADVLEHLEYPEKALKEVWRVVEKYLYITTPPRTDKMSKFHYQEWNPEELKDLVESQGFKLVDKMLIIPEEESIYAKFIKI